MIDKILMASLIEVLSSFPKIKLAIIFGFFARSDEKPDSDIDLGIAASQVLSFGEKSKVYSALVATCKQPVDLIDLQKNMSRYGLKF